MAPTVSLKAGIFVSELLTKQKSLLKSRSAGVAQLVEHPICNRAVGSSSLSASTTSRSHHVAALRVLSLINKKRLWKRQIFEGGASNYSYFPIDYIQVGFGNCSSNDDWLHSFSSIGEVNMTPILSSIFMSFFEVTIKACRISSSSSSDCPNACCIIKLSCIGEE